MLVVPVLVELGTVSPGLVGLTTVGFTPVEVPVVGTPLLGTVLGDVVLVEAAGLPPGELSCPAHAATVRPLTSAKGRVVARRLVLRFIGPVCCGELRSFLVRRERRLWLERGLVLTRWLGMALAERAARSGVPQRASPNSSAQPFESMKAGDRRRLETFPATTE